MKPEPDQHSTNEVELKNAAIGVSCLVLYVRVPNTVRYIVLFAQAVSRDTCRKLPVYSFALLHCTYRKQASSAHCAQSCRVDLQLNRFMTEVCN